MFSPVRTDMAVKRLVVVVYFETANSFGALLADITLISEIRMTPLPREAEQKHSRGNTSCVSKKNSINSMTLWKALRQIFHI